MLGILYFIFISIIVVGLLFLVNSKKASNKKIVKARIIGFVPSSAESIIRHISPVFSYVVNNKEYRCVMYLLTCEDTEQNRLLYINKEYELYYDEKYPNRVTLRNIILYVL